ncbi:MAG: alpha/beta hydrolase-fold protein [Cytophagales bacterium]|uniref:alpha/beta hydrolase n=1 Tax=Fulvivirga sp. TaxID=1931237 RepID=UPI0032F91448
MRSILIITLSLIVNIPLVAQDKQVSIANTESFEIQSKEVDDKYNISVSFPFGYNQSAKEYAVLYVLDANVTFAMVRDIQLLASFEPENASLLVVGVGYENFNSWMSKRSRDYTSNGKGEASKFLAFIENELIPEIDQRYRTNSQRIIYGHSSAALFGLFTLFNSTSFEAFIVTSPSVDEDEEFTFRLEEASKSKQLKGRVYASFGTKEKQLFKSKYQEFVEQLKSRNHQQLKMMSEEFDGSHMTTMAPAFLNGLLFVTKEQF